MNKNLIRYIVITIVFFVSLVVFSAVLNQGNTDMTMEMSKASLPTASILMDDYAVNEMHGYVTRMEEATFRDSVTPIDEDRKLSFQIELFGQHLKSLKFEVRSVDGERLIESTQVTDYEKYKDRIVATVYLKDLIEENQEYNLTIIATLRDGRDVYFYTRVIQCDNSLTKEKLDFVSDFHEKTLHKEQAGDLSKYLEPNSDGDNTTFSYVDIHCSLNQVTYGDMKVEEIATPMITICEPGKKIGTMTVSSLLRVTDGKVENVYMVEEYFRIRHTSERFYLLDYERTMEEIFPMEKNSFANNKIVLGIQSPDVQVRESSGGNIVAFTNAGRIFCYDVSDNKMAQLYSFYDRDNFDKRTYYDKSEIKILDVEENGNVVFVVYGYMNRGSHEGEVGVEVLYYNSLLNTVEEQVFIEYTKSPDVLLQDMEKLTYHNRVGNLFVMIDGSVYKINVENKTYEKVISGLYDNNFRISEDNKMVVWQKETDISKVKTLFLMNLNSEKITEITAGKDEYLHAIGFMGEDLVYGIANETDISTDVLGTTVFPMKKVIIQSEMGKVLKEYENEGIYILDGEIRENQLTLKRAKGTRQDEENPNSPLLITPTTEDQITSNAEVHEGVNHTVAAVTDLYQTVQQIELKKEIEAKSIKFLTPKEVMYEGGRRIHFNEKEDVLRFLVYKKGKITSIVSDPGDTVKHAYETVGTVCDTLGNEIYRRAETVTRNQIMAIKEPGIDKEKSSLAVCLDTILAYEGVSRNTTYMLERGQNAKQILEDNLKNYEILNLSGCPMDAMLYYVNKDIPVLAIREDGSAVLIIGFNEYNIVLMDPKTGKIYKKGMNDSRAMFEEEGNQFMTYIPCRQD